MTGDEFVEKMNKGELPKQFAGMEVHLPGGKGHSIHSIVSMLASKGYTVFHSSSVKDYETFQISGKSYPTSHSSHTPT